MNRNFILLLTLILFDNSLGHGLALNTSVQMKNFSTLPIEAIVQRISQKKLYVRSFDDHRFCSRSSRIKRCGASRSNCYVSFFVTNGHESDEIICTPTQEFYFVDKQGWVKACDLAINNELLCAGGKKVTVSDVVFCDKSIDVYTLEIKKIHTFFVGKFSLLTHNVVFPMDFGVDIIPTLGSSGGVAGSSLGPTGVVVGALIDLAIGLGLRYFYKKKVCEYELTAYNLKNVEKKLNNKKKSAKTNFADNVGSFFPKGPDHDSDDEKDKKKHSHGKYKDADYHHRNSRGGKSPSPKNGQQALDNSVPVPGHTTRRIGVSCNEIVILDQTSPGLYHGHVRTWKELISGGCKQTEKMRSALVKNGLTSSSGKVLL